MANYLSSSASSSNDTAASTTFPIDLWTTKGLPSYYDSCDHEKYGEVSVWSRRIKAFLGVHHAIVIQVGDGYWRVFEWLDDSKVHAYACKIIRGQKCISNLGRRKLGEVIEAARTAAGRRTYRHVCIGPHRYNCNDWTEDVASKLGWSITVHGNCSCVL